MGKFWGLVGDLYWQLLIFVGLMLCIFLNLLGYPAGMALIVVSYGSLILKELRKIKEACGKKK